MVRIKVLFFSIFFFSSNLAFSQLQHPEKIGIGSWEVGSSGTSLKNIEDFGFGWYYNWRTDHMWSPSSSAKRDVQFVPMIWGENNVNESLPANAKTLLGFNEPDHTHQAHLSVEKAIQLWPQLESRGIRLGSPAPTTNQSLGSQSWLGRFMNQADSLGYRVDFIALHYYTTNKNVEEFKQYLEAVHAQYNKPLWVTEWALVDWANIGRFSLEENAKFAEEAIEMLDKLDFVERHAWFSAISDGSGINTYLFDSSNQLTPVGAVFKRMISSTSEPEPTPEPEPSPEPDVDSTKPQVNLLDLEDGDQIQRHKRIRIVASASDNVGVTHVDFIINGRVICSDSQASYSCRWRAPRHRGNVTIEVQAFDEAGNKSDFEPITLIVK